jgi:hypothetical protein
MPINPIVSVNSVMDLIAFAQSDTPDLRLWVSPGRNIDDAEEHRRGGMRAGRSHREFAEG